MPDFHVLPAPGSVSIAAAIKAGRRGIHRPARLLFLMPFVAGIAAAGAGLPLWIPAAGTVIGIAAAWLHTELATPRWRIWAYSGVADLHQLQRCAELDGLLPKQSHLRPVGIMGAARLRRLAELQERFNEDVPFIDDPDVMQVSAIRASFLSLRLGKDPLITISRKGITTWNLGFIPWDRIWDEHVALKSYVSSRTGSGSGSYRIMLCFTCSELMFELPLSQLRVSPSELDQMLYIHRGRYMQDQAGMPSTIPLKSKGTDTAL